MVGWHERVKFIMKGYLPQDAWNTDETGCFYGSLPNRTLANMKKECCGGKMAKERLTTVFFVNAIGEKEPPVIIGNSAFPCSFKGLRDKANPHGLPYFYNSKAWMNTEIMHASLAKLKGDSRTFYEFFIFAIFALLLMPTVWKKYSKIFSRFSFHCNPCEKHSNN